MSNISIDVRNIRTELERNLPKYAQAIADELRKIHQTIPIAGR